MYNFLLSIIVVYAPYISLYRNLKIDLDAIIIYTPEIIGIFIIYSVALLFFIALVLPEVEGYPIQSFITTCVISSFEFVPFHICLKQIKKMTLKTIATFVWAILSVTFHSLFSLYVNSNSQQFSITHIYHAFSTISYLFRWFSALNLCNNIRSIKSLSLENSLCILMFGVPTALGSVQPSKLIPAYVPSIMQIASSYIFYLYSQKVRKVKRN